MGWSKSAVAAVALSALAVIDSSASAADSFGAFKVDGRQKLLGSSFGLIGANSTFDYIVVGGGTAGLTVANRLAAAGRSVAVVEGGGFYELDNGNFSQIPALDTQFANALPSSIQPLVDWGVVTPPQPQLLDREIHYTQGKTLGGSSARNFLAYHRGTEGTYDRWASLVSDDSYRFGDLLKFFKKSCSFTPPDYSKLGPRKYKFDASAFQPGAGPLQVSYPPYYHPFSDGIMKAFRALGLSEISGLNSGKLLGFSAATTTQEPEAQIRSSSETSFGQQTILRTYATFYKQTTASRVTFDSDKVANGVDVNTAGVNYHLTATKEVVVAAGAFRSPQLLMLSGIGPKNTLASFNVPAVSVLEGVGQGMQDQNFFGTVYRVNVETFSKVLSDPATAAKALDDYQTKQSGQLTNSGANYIGWEKVPRNLTSSLSKSTRAMLDSFPSDWPDFELLPLPVQTVPTTDPAANYMSVTLAVLSTNSRGNVTLKSTNPADNPVVTLPWLQTREDQEVAVAAFKRTRQIARASGLVVGDEVAPGPAVQSDPDILKFIQASIGPIHHASCTNRMGNASDPLAVVDSNARVFGVKGLRVVDASAFPILPPGHPQSTVYALAEKIAAQILGSY